MKQLKANLLFILLLHVTLCFFLPVEASSFHVFDQADVLEKSQEEMLEAYAQKITNRYRTGVYIVTVSQNIGDIQPAADHLYHVTYDLGETDEKNGILLMVSINDRDYALITNGSAAEYAFSSYALSELEKAFLPQLKEEHWASAFNAYLAACDEDLRRAAEGHPVKAAGWKSFFVILAVSCLISILICLYLRKKSRTVQKRTQADLYAAGTLQLKESRDVYTHTTVTKTKLPQKTASTANGSKAKAGSF